MPCSRCSARPAGQLIDTAAAYGAGWTPERIVGTPGARAWNRDEVVIADEGRIRDQERQADRRHVPTCLTS